MRFFLHDKGTRSRPMLSTLALFAALGVVGPVQAQSRADPAAADPAAVSRDAGPPWRSLPLTWQVDAERWRLPGGERTGVLGARSLFSLDGSGSGWHAGPALYGAATGRRGGLFAFGGELLWRTPGPAGSRVDAGLFVGGGGGAAAPVGGGLMLRPHLDWQWPVGPAWVGATVSRVSFPDGRIGSTQWGLTLGLDDRFRSVEVGQSAPLPAGWRSGFGVDRAWGVAGRTRGRDERGRHGHGGLRVERSLEPGRYATVEAGAAASGGADGYAEVLLGLGQEWALDRAGAWRVGGRVAAGLAGGGGVDTGGGALLRVAATAHWAAWRDGLIGLELGHSLAPDGRHRATHASLMLGWMLDRPEAAGGGPVSSVRTDDVEWAALVAHFPRVAFRDGSRDTMQTVGLRVRRPIDAALGPHWQVAGELHFAAGGKAGAYGAGLVGLALGTPVSQPGWQWSAELLGGAAGGGGVDSRGGAVLQPMLRAGYGSGAQRWQLAVGRIRSLRGDLDSPLVELSWALALGLPRR
jgi:hypothetical protein